MATARTFEQWRMVFDGLAGAVECHGEPMARMALATALAMLAEFIPAESLPEAVDALQTPGHGALMSDWRFSAGVVR